MIQRMFSPFIIASVFLFIVNPVYAEYVVDGNTTYEITVLNRDNFHGISCFQVGWGCSQCCSGGSISEYYTFPTFPNGTYFHNYSAPLRIANTAQEYAPRQYGYASIETDVTLLVAGIYHFYLGKSDNFTSLKARVRVNGTEILSENNEFYSVTNSLVPLQNYTSPMYFDAGMIQVIINHSSSKSGDSNFARDTYLYYKIIVVRTLPENETPTTTTTTTSTSTTTTTSSSTTTTTLSNYTNETTTSTTIQITTTTTNPPSGGGGGGGGGGGPPVTVPVCRAQGAAICETGLECPGKWLKSSDSERCCSVVCVPPKRENKSEEIMEDKKKTRGADDVVSKVETPTEMVKIVTEIDKVKSIVHDEMKKEELEKIGTLAVNVSKYLGDFEVREGSKGILYSLKRFLGLAVKEEEEDARFLDSHAKSLRELALNMSALAGSIDDEQAKNILAEQSSFLQKMSDGAIRKAEEKQRSARGIFSFFLSLFG